jgi:hypothetical protein
LSGKQCGAEASFYHNFMLCDPHQIEMSSKIGQTARQAAGYYPLGAFPGWCYVVQMDDGYIKVGYSNNDETLGRRIDDLKPLAVLFVIPGGFVAEAILHERLSDCRVPGRGERFDCSMRRVGNEIGELQLHGRPDGRHYRVMAGRPVGPPRAQGHSVPQGGSYAAAVTAARTILSGLDADLSVAAPLSDDASIALAAILENVNHEGKTPMTGKHLKQRYGIRSEPDAHSALKELAESGLVTRVSRMYRHGDVDKPNWLGKIASTYEYALAWQYSPPEVPPRLATA